MLIKLPFNTTLESYYDNSLEEFGHHVHTGGGYWNIDAFRIFGYEFDNNKRTTYGVCDTVEQVLETYKDIVNGDDLYLLMMRKTDVANQPERDGWRWHKHGRYIGNYESQWEYVFDDYYSDGLKDYLTELRGTTDTTYHFIMQFSLIPVVKIPRIQSDPGEQHKYRLTLEQRLPDYFDEPFWYVSWLNEQDVYMVIGTLPADEAPYIHMMFETQEGAKCVDSTHLNLKLDGTDNNAIIPGSDVYYLHYLYDDSWVD